MSRRLRILFVLTTTLTVLVPGNATAQQPDTTKNPPPTAVVKTKDGSTFVGQLVESTRDSVRIVTRGGTLTFARADLENVREVRETSIREGVYWPENPHATRLFFAPTGRMLGRGEGYFSDVYLFFLSAVGGVTDRLTLGGGMSVFPLDDFSENFFYALPKIGLVQSDHFNLAAGALVGYSKAIDDESLGILYGVSTFGGMDASLTTGIGYGFAGGEIARNPIFMLGGETRVSRRTSLVTENYVFTGGDDLNGLVSYGVRFFGEKLSVDMAFFNPLSNDAVFPGIPYVSFAVKF